MAKKDSKGRDRDWEDEEFSRKAQKARKLKLREIEENDDDESYEEQIARYMSPNRK